MADAAESYFKLLLTLSGDPAFVEARKVTLRIFTTHCMSVWSFG